MGDFTVNIFRKLVFGKQLIDCHFTSKHALLLAYYFGQTHTTLKNIKLIHLFHWDDPVW